MNFIKKEIRTIVQVIYFALTNGYAAGFMDAKIYQGKLKGLCVPGLNCYSCPGALGSCPIGALQAVIGSTKFSFSYYLAGFFIVVGMLLGRFVCGWLCPFGLIQDLLYKIPFFQKRKNLPGHKWLRFLKYFILVGFVVLFPLLVVDIIGQGTPGFCKYICPSGTILGGIPFVILDDGIRESVSWLFTWKVFLLAFLLVLSLWVYRPFCKYLCPLGAIYGWFHPISLYQLQIDQNKCTGCSICQEVCPMDIPVYCEPNSMECIRCKKCEKKCPHHALQFTFGNNTLKRRAQYTRKGGMV